MKRPRAIMLDTGPLVALVNQDDNRHRQCLRTLKQLPGATSVFTVSSVLAEAFWLLPSGEQTVELVFNCLSALNCKVVPLEQGQQVCRPADGLR